MSEGQKVLHRHGGCWKINPVSVTPQESGAWGEAMRQTGNAVSVSVGSITPFDYVEIHQVNSW